MLRFNLYVIIFCLVLSCNLKKDKKENCSYSIDHLLKDFDSSQFERIPFEEKIDFIEKKSSLGERGIYTFDKNNILRFYGFLINSNNEYDFSIQYDSLGNEISRTGRDVVQWYFRKLENDSLKVTFLLYSANYSFSNISLQLKNKSINNIKLFKSPLFSNLIGNSIVLPLVQGKDTVFISGQKVNLCTGKSQRFEDFVLIPKEVSATVGMF
jgi:hypothetical protein